MYHLCKSSSSFLVLLPSFQHLLRGCGPTNIWLSASSIIPKMCESKQCQSSLTYAVVHLIAVLLQVVLDAALEEVQLGFQLLREAEHAVFTLGQVGVVAQETQPGGGDGRGHVGQISQVDERMFQLWLSHRCELLPVCLQQSDTQVLCKCMFGFTTDDEEICATKHVGFSS